MKHFKALIFIFLLLCVLNTVYAQTGKIQGFVSMEDGEGLPGIAVSIEGTKMATFTDTNGFFSFTGIAQGEVTLVAELEGFEKMKRTVLVQNDTTIVANFTIEMAKVSEEAVVVAEKPLLTNTEEISEVILTPSQISSLPSLGEKDVFRAFQLLPGISGSNEASSGLYVRGGTPDQNLILYDGFTIYHVDHLFGYFSAFNMEAVESARLNKGGYSAKYGGRLSSIVELYGKTGSTEEFHYGAGLSMLSLNAYAEIPLFKKGSIVIAGRRSFQSPLYNSIADMFNNDNNQGRMTARQGPGGGRFGSMYESDPSSYFYDLNAKAEIFVSPKDTFSLSFYNGKDDLDNSRTMNTSPKMEARGMTMEGEVIDLTEWGNTGLSFQWERNWSPLFQSQFTAAYSNYFNNRDRTNSMILSFDPDSGIEPPAWMNIDQPRSFERGSVEDNDLSDLTFRLDNSLDLASNNRLEFGIQVTANHVTYDFELDEFREENEDNGEDSQPGRGRQLVGILDREDEGILYAVYLQDRWTLFERLTITPGLRVSYFDLTEEWYYEPRLSFNFKLTDSIRFKGAWGNYFQFAKKVVREDTMQGNREFWVLSDGDNIPVGSATHYIAGVSYESEEFLIDIEGYYKELAGLSEFALRFTPISEDENYNQYFNEGTGVAQGIEFLLQKKFGDYTGWLAYTLGQVEYEFPDLSDTPFPALQDQTHEFKLVNSYTVGNWTFAGTWIYATGKPYTEPVGIESIELPFGRTINRVIMGDKNGARLPAYHRMDLSATLDFEMWTGDAQLGMTVFNVYDRTNVWYKEFDIIEGEIIKNNFNLMGLTFNLFFNIKF